MGTPYYEIEEFDGCRPAKLAFAAGTMQQRRRHTHIHHCLFMAQGVGKIREVKDAVIRSFVFSAPGDIVVFDLDLPLT